MNEAITSFQQRSLSRGSSGSSEGTMPNYERWAIKLEYVLEDFDGLKHFETWMRSFHTDHPIQFYYAINGYKKKFEQNEAAKFMLDLAKEIYWTFLKRSQPKAAPKPCYVLDNKKKIAIVSENIVDKVSRVFKMDDPTPAITPDLFDECKAEVIEYLRKQHCAFIQSEIYLDSVNEQRGDVLGDSSSAISRSPSVASSQNDGNNLCADMKSVMNITYSNAPTEPIPPPIPPRHTSNIQNAPNFPPKRKHHVPLTSKALESTVRHRENTIIGNILFPHVNNTVRPPYVCAANTSKNDSAISSAFSSDASGNQYTIPNSASRHKYQMWMNDHVKYNQTVKTGANIPRTAHMQHNVGSVDIHGTSEGREKFYKLLVSKLDKFRREEEMSLNIFKALNDIGTGRRNAREVVGDVYELEHRNDEDEDVEDYMNRWKQNSSSKPSPGSQRSPGFYPNAPLRRRSPKSSSPERRLMALNNQSTSLTGSFPAAPYSTNGYGFAPPPVSNKYRQHNPNMIISNNVSIGNKTMPSNRKKHEQRLGLAIGDTSGISSAGISSFSNQSDKFRMPEKNKKQMINKQKQKAMDSCSRSSAQGRSQPETEPSMTIGYYTDTESTPYVKKIPRGSQLTFQEFKRHFALNGAKGERKQFFFRSPSDDPREQFQMVLITEENQMVPVFESRIMAELKAVDLD